MKLNISTRLIIISLLPAIIISAALSAYFMTSQFNSISDALDKRGTFIAKQLSPTAEYAVYSGNTEFIKPIIENMLNEPNVMRIQIQDKLNHDIIDIKKEDVLFKHDRSVFEIFFSEEKQLVYREAILSETVKIEDLDAPDTDNRLIRNQDMFAGNVIVTLTNHYAVHEKAKHIQNGALITLAVLFLATVIIIRNSHSMARPIKALTNTVRDITSGNLEANVDKGAAGEIGVLQSCIAQMKDELKHSKSDMENQLSQYTHELQETMEELEIRNAELDITRSKAIYANKAKSEFLANMSHEIRTPLSGIIGFTELLQNTQLSSQQKDYATTIQNSSKNLLDIINDILDLSKIEAGKTEISTSEFNLINLIEDIVNLLSPTALVKNVELFYRIDNDVPRLITADPFHLHQVLTNLIGNAIKFTEEGYVYLQVKNTNADVNENEASITFSISDTGIGMNTNDKKKLFNSFTQADTSITRRFGGSGLGLVISRKLVLLMKGDIGFDSTKNKGSTFWFNIPVTASQQATTASELANKKIAFISDHLIATQAFKSLLQNFQCQVNHYNFDELQKLDDIESKHDIIAVFLSRNDRNNKATLDRLNKLSFSIPSLLIASTRSHKVLKGLQNHIFDSAAFTSERSESIKNKLIYTLNRNAPTQNVYQAEEIVDNTADWSNINILVVDDNEVNLRLAEIILKNHKANVTTARSGAQAINYATINSFDIIFMDLHMPVMDGYETTKKIRDITTGEQAYIIAVTANIMSKENERIIESGMNGSLIKPLSYAMLQNIINQWSENRRIKFDQPSNDNSYAAHSATQKQDNNNENTIFSIEQAMEFTGNNEPLAYELFAMLRAELDAYRQAIKQAIINNDLTELHAQAHKLHGASRCCGTNELKEASSRIETLIKQNIAFDIEKESQTLLTAIQNVVDFKL